MKFLLCTWDGGEPVDSRDMVRSCLARAAAPPAAAAAIEKCIDGAEGKRLMRESAAAVKAAKVERSCTVVIDGKKRCVRDGGRWYDCPGGSSEADFVASLCQAYAAKNGALPAPEGCPGAGGGAAAAAGGAAGDAAGGAAAAAAAGGDGGRGE